MANADHRGDDIKNIGSDTALATLAAACDADCTCYAFNSLGWIKQVGTVNIASPGVCLYSRVRGPYPCGTSGLGSGS